MTIKPETLIDGTEVSAIMEAAGLEVIADPPSATKLLDILAQAISEIIRKAPDRKRMTRREIERVEKLHDRFDTLLRSYQGTGNPPPLLPTVPLESGTHLTPWQRWLDTLKFHDPKRQDSINWTAVANLLVIYEMLFGKTVVAENAEMGDSKPVVFLNAAFALVKSSVAEDRIRIDPWYYKAPSVSSLNARLRDLRANEMRFARKRIDHALSNPDQ